jgi:mycothiol synthase
MTPQKYPLPLGFTSRNASLDDAEMAADMGRDYSLATTGFSDVDGETLRNQWQSPRFDPAQDVYFVFNPDGRLVGYCEAWTNGDPPVHPFIWGAVAVDCQNLGIGTHLLGWAEGRVRNVLDKVPADIRVAPLASFPTAIIGARTLLENNGWSYLRSHFTMRIDLNSAPPAPQYPAGISLRTYQPELAESIYRAVDEAFRDHFGHVDQPFESAFARFKKTMIGDPLFDGNLWTLAMEGDQIAGVCLCQKKAWDDPESGYVNILGVRRPWRKKGLGLALLRQAFGEFHRRGYRKISLGVDASNITGALRLYEKAGMKVIRQFDMHEKEIRAGRELRVQ